MSHAIKLDSAAGELRDTIRRECPEGREREAALALVDQALAWARSSAQQVGYAAASRLVAR